MNVWKRERSGRWTCRRHDSWQVVRTLFIVLFLHRFRRLSPMCNRLVFANQKQLRLGQLSFHDRLRWPFFSGLISLQTPL